jgi:hypothetical protein
MRLATDPPNYCLRQTITGYELDVTPQSSLLILDECFMIQYDLLIV